MKGSGIILTICATLVFLDLTTTIFADSMLPLAAAVSYLIMSLFGAFKSSGANATRDDEPELTPRQEEFLNKLKNSLPDRGEDLIVISMVDPDGTAASLTINKTGKVEITGDVDPKLISAVQNLTDETLAAGPEAIMNAISEILEEINNRK